MRSLSLGMLLVTSATPLAGQDLQRELDRVVARSGLTAGVAVVDLTGGPGAEVRGTTGFTMMSVFKLPVGIALLRRVARRELSLDATVRVGWNERRAGPGRDPLAARTPRGGLAITYRELLRLAVEESDNTAADALLSRLGVAAVNRELAEAGITGVRIDREEGQLALDYSGATLPAGAPRTPEAVRAARERVSAADRARAAARFPLDPRDTATPRGMAALLVALHRGRLLPPAETRLLLAMMERTVTGPNRLRAGLPRGTRLAHRTGSAGGGGRMAAINDVGLITVPGHAPVAVAVFVRDAPEAAGERLIAEVARHVYANFQRAGAAASPAVVRRRG